MLDYDPIRGQNSRPFDFEGEPVDFLLHYVQSSLIIIKNVDAETFNILIDDDFSHTLELFANVYDVDGNLLEGVQVQSALGFNYRNFSTVPEPSSIGILAFCGLAVSLRRRRRT